jgi:spore maturation protein CgeB
MNLDRLDIVVLGLSITSSWGNGHAATYRALLRAMAARGHHVLFLERDVPSYAQNRDLPEPSFCDTSLYTNLNDLQTRFGDRVRNADAVIVGSYVPEGVAVAGWVLEHARGLAAFYDIDTPITLAKLAARDYEYLRPELIPRFHLYLSFAGGARRMQHRPGTAAVTRAVGHRPARAGTARPAARSAGPHRRAPRRRVGNALVRAAHPTR